MYAVVIVMTGTESRKVGITACRHTAVKHRVLVWIVPGIAKESKKYCASTSFCVDQP